VSSFRSPHPEAEILLSLEVKTRSFLRLLLPGSSYEFGFTEFACVKSRGPLGENGKGAHRGYVGCRTYSPTLVVLSTPCFGFLFRFGVTND
jgi:hypothetical protein